MGKSPTLAVADTDGRSRDEAVGLVDGDALRGQVAAPATGPDTFGHPEGGEPQAPEQPTRRRFLAGAKAPPDLLYRDHAYPGLSADAAQSPEACRCRSTPQRIDDRGRVQEEPGHRQPARRGSPCRCRRVQAAGSSSQS